MIGIVNYGLGNIQAIANIYNRLNIAHCIVSEPQEMDAATRFILPGVGAFDWAMSRLNASGLRASLERRVQDEGVPVLGICVGMQMMASRSDEGEMSGLGWIPADVRKFSFEAAPASLPLPHMGWNDVSPSRISPLFSGLEQKAQFYFLHSYYFAPHDPADVLATAHYGSRYACSVGRANVFGVQFHPEKSHHWGVNLLKNFAQESLC
jgi:glutamine amidotransferase